jgi:hypothetical protein
MFAAEEDEHGTYFMNSKDLRAVQHVDRLTKMGIASLKIEGRTKSYFYRQQTFLHHCVVPAAFEPRLFLIVLMSSKTFLTR